MDNQPSHMFRRAVYLAVGLLVIVIATWAIFSQSHKGMAKIRIYVVPKDSTVSMDGKQLSARTVYIVPGNHTFVASRQYFTADTETIDASIKGPNNLYLAPTPYGPNGQQWVADNPNLEKTREYYAGLNQAKRQALLIQKYPIIKFLPVDTVNFNIIYGASLKYPNDPTKIALYVTAPEANRPLALHWIKYEGFDPNNYEIIYRLP